MIDLLFILVVLMVGFKVLDVKANILKTNVLKAEEEVKKKVGEEKKKEAMKKGLAFEDQIVAMMEEFSDCKVIQSLIIPNTKKTGTTEVDILVLSKKGILAVECKNYSGMIVGNKSMKYWEVHYGANRVEKMYNPVMQNNSHIAAMKNIFPNIKYKNIVAISENVKLGDKMENIPEIHTINELKSLISEMSCKKDVYTDGEINSIYDYLLKINSSDKASHIEFVNKIKKAYEN